MGWSKVAFGVVSQLPAFQLLFWHAQLLIPTETLLSAVGGSRLHRDVVAEAR